MHLHWFGLGMAGFAAVLAVAYGVSAADAMEGAVKPSKALEESFLRGEALKPAATGAKAPPPALAKVAPTPKSLPSAPKPVEQAVKQPEEEPDYLPDDAREAALAPSLNDVAPAAGVEVEDPYTSPTVKTLEVPAAAKPGAPLPEDKPESHLGRSAEPMRLPAESWSNSSGALAIQTAGDVRYVSGGVGAESRAQLEAVKPEFNLHITSAERSGAYVGDTEIRILNSKGEALLSVVSDPYFYVQLPAGKYTVEAVVEGTTKKQVITLPKQGARRVHFSW